MILPYGQRSFSLGEEMTFAVKIGKNSYEHLVLYFFVFFFFF